jgi:S-adenosylmethionine:tRNA ribosyltransferase-isomerase
MNTAEFDYVLPPELIAQQPLPERTASRLLVIDRASGSIRHEMFRNLPRYLRPGDLLVLNDTKVLPARLWSIEPRLELLLIEPRGSGRWTALVKPGRRARPGTVLKFAPWPTGSSAEPVAVPGGCRRIRR